MMCEVPSCGLKYADGRLTGSGAPIGRPRHVVMSHRAGRPPQVVQMAVVAPEHDRVHACRRHERDRIAGRGWRSTYVFDVDRTQHVLYRDFNGSVRDLNWQTEPLKSRYS